MAEKSFIQASVPKERGPARHFETTGLAMTSYRTRNGKPQVEEIHTPQTTLQRIHEVMHARHSSGLGADHDYPGVNREVAEIVEDCRLHLQHWPWPDFNTPTGIALDVKVALDAELTAAKSEKAKTLHPFARFGTRLRAQAVAEGAGVGTIPIGYDDLRQAQLATELLREIAHGNAQYAAAVIHKMFYADEDEEEKAEKAEQYKIKVEDSGKPAPPKPKKPTPVTAIEDIIAKHIGGPPNCIIEVLPLTEPTTGTTDGWRMATTGSRIYRPALRRPVLPQRLFMKRSPQEPGGAIIFDASGSMRVTIEVLIECCRRAPTAAVAYYRGTDWKGKIWVFAYNGMRANNLGDIGRWEQGNTVDGPAMDWLLAQDSPHIMVTDREFCGANDSHHQKMRLQKFEDTGQIKVYTSYKEFMEAYPVSERAA